VVYDDQQLKTMAYVKKEILFNKNGYKGILKMRKARDDGGLFNFFLQIDKFVRWMREAESAIDRTRMSLDCAIGCWSRVSVHDREARISRPVSLNQFYRWTKRKGWLLSMIAPPLCWEMDFGAYWKGS
jgi:hypothetical protein